MNIKKIVDRILENIYLLIIIIGIWLTLIGLFIFIKIYIVPLAPISPLSGNLWDLITSGVQFFLTVVYCLGGLYVWYRIIKMYFWRKMEKSGQIKEETAKIIDKEN